MEDSFDSARLMFYSWATAWVNSSDVSQGSSENGSLDVPELVQLFRCLGFKIRHSSTYGTNDITPVGSTDSALACGCRTVLSCDRSGQRFIMEASGGACTCPRQAEITSWHMSAHVPFNSQEQLQNLDTAGSTLIPSVNSGMAKMVNTVIGHLVEMLKTNNKSTDRETDAQTSAAHELHSQEAPFRYRSLDTLMTAPFSPMPKPLSKEQQGSETMIFGSDNKMELGGSREFESSVLPRQKTWTCLTSETDMPQHIPTTDASASVLVRKLSQINNLTTEMAAILKGLHINVPNIDDTFTENDTENTGIETTPKPFSETESPSSASAPALLEGKQRTSTPGRTLSNLTAFMRKERNKSVKSPSTTPATMETCGKKSPLPKEKLFKKPKVVANSPYGMVINPSSENRTVKRPMPLTPRPPQRVMFGRSTTPNTPKRDSKSKIAIAKK